MRWALGFAMLTLIGCGQTTIDDAFCPPGGTSLTYESFGKRFFDVHCIECHGGSGGYSSRAFPSVTRIRDDKDRIFVVATPDGPSMPPGPDDPPASERAQLAEWLACGAP